jgi:LysM repeat protein
VPVVTVSAVALAGAQALASTHGWVATEVRPGDTVFDLAAFHRTSVAAIVLANHLPAGGRLIRTGQRLLLPPSTHAHGAARPARPAYATHVVRSGETISELAARLRVSPADLLAANRLDHRGRIYVGQHLRVPMSAARTAAKAAVPTTTLRSYRVRTGDTVSALAVRFHASASAIIKANHLSRNAFLRAGQVLRVPVRRSAPSATATTFTGRTYPDATARAAARNRTTLAHRHLPSRTATRDLIERTARRYGVDPALAVAVAWQESGWSQREVSVANAIGTMQVVPATGAWASSLVGRRLDLLSTSDNVTAGVVVLHALLRSAPTREAVAGYYQGLGSVQAHGMYADTRAYVRSVLALRARFA